MSLKKSKPLTPDARAAFSALHDVANDPRALRDLTRADLLKIIDGAMSALKTAQGQIDLLTKTNAQLKLEKEEAEKNALEDPLTKLPSLRAYQERMEDLFDTLNDSNERFKRRASEITVKSISMILVDLDMLSTINKTYGLEGGDRAIETLGREIVKGSIRHKTDFCARIGGDEFVIVVPNGNEKIIKIITDRIDENIKKTVVVMDNGVTLKVGATYGSATVYAGSSLCELKNTANEDLTKNKTDKGSARDVKIIAGSSPIPQPAP